MEAVIRSVDSAPPLSSHARLRTPRAMANTAINAIRTQGRPLAVHYVSASFSVAVSLHVSAESFRLAAKQRSPTNTATKGKVVTAAMQTIAALSVALMVVGLLVGFVYPGPITGALLPVGLTLWCLVGLFARRQESSVTG
jgi:hypothetical protein